MEHTGLPLADLRLLDVEDRLSGPTASRQCEVPLEEVHDTTVNEPVCWFFWLGPSSSIESSLALRLSIESSPSVSARGRLDAPLESESLFILGGLGLLSSEAGERFCSANGWMLCGSIPPSKPPGIKPSLLLGNCFWRRAKKSSSGS